MAILDPWNITFAAGFTIAVFIGIWQQGIIRRFESETKEKDKEKGRSA